MGQWQAAARDLTTQTGIKRDYSREFAATDMGKQPHGIKPKAAVVNRVTLQKEYKSIIKKYGSETAILQNATKAEIKQAAEIKQVIDLDTVYDKGNDYKKLFEKQIVSERKLTHKTLKNLSDTDKKKLTVWTTSKYEQINNFMRNGQKTADIQRIANGIHNALEKAQVTESLYVRRGTSKDYISKLAGSDDWIKNPSMLIGETLTDKVFLATTPSIKGGFSGEVMIYYKVPANTKGAYIANLSEYKNEKELLFQNSLPVKVMEVREQKIGGSVRFEIFVDMEE